MRRRDTAAGERVKTRRRKAMKPKRRQTPARGRGPSPADLQEQLDIRTRELNEALEQQTATSEENVRLLNELR